ncbi:MAG: hypothetical protein AAF914_01370 [Pseudomonadota bacterium]
MRATLLFAGLLWATAASAQSPRDQAAQLMAAALQTQGYSAEVSAGIVPCFLDRLNDRQVAALLAAETEPARDEVMQGMRDRDGANACAAAVIFE